IVAVELAQMPVAPAAVVRVEVPFARARETRPPIFVASVWSLRAIVVAILSAKAALTPVEAAGQLLRPAIIARHWPIVAAMVAEPGGNLVAGAIEKSAVVGASAVGTVGAPFAARPAAAVPVFRPSGTFVARRIARVVTVIGHCFFSQHLRAGRAPAEHREINE